MNEAINESRVASTIRGGCDVGDGSFPAAKSSKRILLTREVFCWQ
jgi:hypothetical protein